MKYDPFQKEAFEYINQGHSVLVSAPTGAGKTVIAEHVIQTCLDQNKKVIYTAPIKALSNQKYREFRQAGSDRVGILTGDVTINKDAPTLIMTTEIFRNKILEEHSSLNEYGWVIFDEIHYLDDLERGSVWEESLIFLPDHMNVLGLSATIPNLKQFAGWLNAVHHRPIKMIIEKHRPVPLHFYFQCQGKIYDSTQDLKEKGFVSKFNRHYPDRSIPRSEPTRPNLSTDLIRHVQENEWLPCIYFVFSRRRTESLAAELQGFNFLTKQESQSILKQFDQLCAEYDLSGEASAQKIRPFIQRGIGYHHAGMLPTLKETIEHLFTTRLIKVIFTTETFALGINMPARTVIFDELRKFYGFGHDYLKTRDFYQMAGRAGRRSIDDEGHVFCRINPHFISADGVEKVIYGQPEKIISRFNAAYATILNLYQKYREQLYDIYPKSFHFYQERKTARRQAVEFLKTKVRLLKQLGLIRKNQLTSKGIFAANVYGYELILSELYDQSFLETLEAKALGVLCLALVFEPRKGIRRPPFTKTAFKIDQTLFPLTKDIIRHEKKLRIRPLTKKPAFHLTPALEAWMENASFDVILELTDVDEGEIIRYFRMTIQMLREIGAADIPPELKSKLHQVIDLINRDVVDAEKQLRH